MPISPDIVARVRRALPEFDPLPAEQIAQRANLGRSQTYQALVHLYDRGQAYMSQAPVTRRIEGWTS